MKFVGEKDYEDKSTSKKIDILEEFITKTFESLNKKPIPVFKEAEKKDILRRHTYKY